MNRKTLILLAITTIVLTMGAGCASKTTTTDDNTEQQETDRNSKDVPPLNAIGQPGLYENSMYGFTLTFPETWKGYTAQNRTLTWGADTSDSVDFGFAVQDGVFNISIHNHSQWRKIKSEEGPTPTYLDENSQYVFGYSTGQEVANDAMLLRMEEVQEIIKTFKLFSEPPRVGLKRFEEYFATRQDFENSEMVKDPEELGLKELATVAVTCPDSLGTPCAGNFLVLSKNSVTSGEQEFYLAFTMGTGYTYYGPFTDELQRVVEEAKTIESFERSY